MRRTFVVVDYKIIKMTLLSGGILILINTFGSVIKANLLTVMCIIPGSISVSNPEPLLNFAKIPAIAYPVAHQEVKLCSPFGSKTDCISTVAHTIAFTSKNPGISFSGHPELFI